MITNNDDNMSRLDKTDLERACELIDAEEEKALAELGVTADLASWPGPSDLSSLRTQLTKDECEDALVNLCVLWDVDDQDYWYPLRQDDPACEDIVAFYTPFFKKNLGNSVVRRILKKHNISVVKELREGGTGELLKTDELEIYYSGLEGYWTSYGYDWLIYASHEDSTTVAGTWLLKELKLIWPDWKDGLYRSPFANDYL